MPHSALAEPTLEQEPVTRGSPSYRWGLILLGSLVTAAIFLVKSTALHRGSIARVFLIYSVFVTSFEISRLIGASFHGRTMRDCYADTAGYAPTVSFVIPCMNERAAITHTVQMCFAAEYPPEDVEVIVVNDGSTDGTGEVLDMLAEVYPRLTVVHWARNQGKRHGMAEGFRRARGEIIIQLDSDSYIEPSSIRDLVAPFAHAEIGAVCAHADPANAGRNLLTKMQAAYYFQSFRILKAAESSFMAVFCCSGCSSAYRRSVVMPMLEPWLAERFLGKPVTWGDDRALTNRVLRAGFRTIYTDRAQAYTICPDNLRQLLKQQVRWKKGWLVNTLRALPFVLRKYPFVGLTYFLPLAVLTLATPIMAGRALVFQPLFQHTVPLYYVAGVFGVACLVTLFYRYVGRRNKYWPFVFAWSVLNMFVLSFVLVYAVLTIQNRKWGTR